MRREAAMIFSSIGSYFSDLMKAIQAAAQIVGIVHSDRQNASDRLDAAISAMKPLPPPEPPASPPAT